MMDQHFVKVDERRGAIVVDTPTPAGRIFWMNGDDAAEIDHTPPMS